MKADATGLFVTAAAKVLQLVGILTVPDANGVPFSIADKKSSDAMLGKLTLSGCWLVNCQTEYMRIVDIVNDNSKKYKLRTKSTNHCECFSQ